MDLRRVLAQRRTSTYRRLLIAIAVAIFSVSVPVTALAAVPQGAGPQYTVPPGGGGGSGPFQCSFSHDMWLSGTTFEAEVSAYCNAPTDMYISFSITSYPWGIGFSAYRTENPSNGDSASGSHSCAPYNNTYEMDGGLWINGGLYGSFLYLATLNCT